MNTVRKAACRELMHMERPVASLSDKGIAEILDESFMPYDIYLEEGEDLDTRLNNLDNFRHWCASRVLSLDRTYAKELLNSIGAPQSMTDRDRANISLSYHCVSLTDVYWVRETGEDVSFGQINLYDNSLNEAIVPLSLKGRPMTVTNQELAPDLSTKGCFPKAWIRVDDGFRLLKDGGEDSVKRELLASSICQCFDVSQVVYKRREYEGEAVTESEIITSKERSIVSKMAYEVYAVNNELDVIEECIRIDKQGYYAMNILDYLTGNTDRHPENWGFWVDNATNRPISLHPLMDFNQCFLAYDSIDGAGCQTLAAGRKLSQRGAAIEAVEAIGLPMVRDMDMSLFGDMEKEAEMFWLRLNLLKEHC